MAKNIVVCCDGTANEFAQDRTNVVKLFFTLRQDRSRQVSYYHPGLGTMEPPGALTGLARKTTRLLDQAFGSGLDRDIRDAYVFIMNNFVEGDRIFLFGFSRGAFTVRAVASLLRMYGLMAEGNDTAVPYAIRMFTGLNRRRNAAGDPQTPASSATSPFRLADEFKQTFSRPCRPYFVGVWDTVSSVGWVDNPLWLPYTADNCEIAIGRHAVAIDERRAFFRSNLWTPRRAPPQGGPLDLKQVWFPGVHADVGGGYPEAESALAKVPLRWMLSEATKAGLLVDDKRVDLILGELGGGYVKADPTAPAHESLTWPWWPAELVLKRHYDWATSQWERRMNLGRRRTVPAKSLVHDAAYLRGAEYLKNFPADCVRVPTEEIPPTADGG
jgi:uncharacterized protein (DUF2235 family)